eukprot:TRINITY_DN9555_c0_g1_i1.p1 TRINITY_DN9555_c0_g1~~TRINITY_DN9555_c0_g1_i1.p1  ORF type:complete len:170 (+),score=76.56 TRINITY_DN9555_c0_g1_i1:60-512(+)
MGKLKKQPKRKKKAAGLDGPTETVGAGVCLQPPAAAPPSKGSQVGMTKGKLKKRQHGEWKKLRASLAELAKEKRTYSNHDHDEKRERKLLRKKIIELKDDMRDRHQQELVSLETAAEETRARAQVSAVVHPRVSAQQRDQLQAMFAHLTT